MAIPYTPTANTVALWHLEDVNDSSGQGHNLTNNGAITFGAGRFSNCADLGTPNTTKWLSINDTLGLATHQADSYTVIMWLYMTTAPAEGDEARYTLFKILNASENEQMFAYFLDGATRIIRVGQNNGSGGQDVNITQTLPLNEWFCLMIQKSTTNYIVGVNGIAGSPNAYTLADGTRGGTSSFSVGAEVGGYGKFSGNMDEIIVENYAWTAAQFLAYYNATSGSQSVVWFFMKQTKQLWDSVGGIYRPKETRIVTI